MKLNSKKAVKVVRKAIRIYSLCSTATVLLKCIGARGLGKEDDKALIEDASLLRAGLAPDNFECIQVGEDLIPCKFSPYAMIAFNQIGSIAITLSNGSVLYDNYFRTMTKESQTAILAHELGHIKCNHNPGPSYKKDRLKCILTGTVLPMELEADAYGVGIVGKDAMITALKEVSKCTCILSKIEIKNRIEAIRKM